MSTPATAHRTDGVEPPDLPADRLPPGGRRRQSTGEGRPDADRDEEERSHAEQKIEDGDPARSVRPAESHEEKIGQPLEAQENARRRDADGGLDRGERGGTRRALAQEPHVGAGADGETDQHRDEHRRERIGRAADDESERTRPSDLEDHGRGAGDGHGR